MHVPAHTTFKAVEAGRCLYLGLFWYVHVPRYVQSVLVCLVCFGMCMYLGMLSLFDMIYT